MQEPSLPKRQRIGFGFICEVLRIHSLQQDLKTTSAECCDVCIMGHGASASPSWAAASCFGREGVYGFSKGRGRQSKQRIESVSAHNAASQGRAARS